MSCNAAVYPLPLYLGKPTKSNRMNREIVLVMGLTGWGKSWWSKLYHQGFSRSFVYDPAMSFQANYAPMDTIVSTMLDQEHPPSTFRWGFNSADDVEAAGGLCFALGDNVLFIEELATVFEKGQARMPEWAKRICFYGRHKSCSLVLIAQRPTYIPIDFRSQANRVITFCQHESSDTDWLCDFYDRERMKRLNSMEKFYCFDYHNGAVTEYSIAQQVHQTFGIKLDRTQSGEITLV